jgi:hypothetical protein
LAARFEDWWGRIESATVKRQKALDLYCGNSWSAVKSCFSDPAIRAHLRLWIVSAGHGLISSEDMLVPYGATFASGEADSVIPSNLAAHKLTDWWEMMVKKKRRQGIKVASIADIVSKHPGETVLVALSKDYFKAISSDLLAAREKMKDRNRFVIIAVGAQKDGPLAENFLPCDSRMEHCLGRSRMAINPRILKYVLANFSPAELRMEVLKAHFETLMRHLPKATYPKRKKATDLDVSKFIVNSLAANSAISYTDLLRKYRFSGIACEQKRFRGLFCAAKIEMKARKVL